MKAFFQALFGGLLASLLAPIDAWLAKRSAVKAALTEQKLADAEKTIEAVRNQNEMREDIANASDDSIDRELRQPWR